MLTAQIVYHLTGTAQKHGHTLVSAIVANPQAGADGVAYHVTVPRVRHDAARHEYPRKVWQQGMLTWSNTTLR